LKNIPLATYRLQFNPDFGFAEARKVLGYLSDLGISTIYASPIFKARKGSLHGYDVVDPTTLNPELGTREELDALLDEVAQRGMTWIQDIVPNHMAFDPDNEMLVDVLENGPSSKYFQFFDVEWDYPYEGIRGRLLAPFLGKFYGECLESGELRLVYDQNGFAIHYYDFSFPLAIETYAEVLTHNLSTLIATLGRSHPNFIKFLGILGVIYLLKAVPSSETPIERYDRIKFIKVMLWELYGEETQIRDHIDRNTAVFNGNATHPESMQLLEMLLQKQFFRLSYWKVASEEINYRRFFNINELISLRMEDRSVLAHTHSLIFRLIDEGRISGLRIDHVDGLYDPTAYLRALRARIGGDKYVVVEKILASNEDIPDFWPVHGTTGYDFTYHLNGLFCQQRNEKAFDGIHSKFSGSMTPYQDLVFEKKRLIAEKYMAGDVENLARLIKNLTSRHRRASDITMSGLRRAIEQVMTVFPVYRTYIGRRVYRPEDRLYIRQALDLAAERDPELHHELGFMKDLLEPEFRDRFPREERKEWLHIVMRFQQLTGPLMAKGFEDTALYLYNRLVSLNEVGGDPGRFGISVSSFHEFSERRARRAPHSMSSGSTHDSKRGEDVRARINVLSEIPHEWEKMIRLWSKFNKKHKYQAGKTNMPSANDEYLLYQTLVGAFPFLHGPYSETDYRIFSDRIKAYMIKAAREGKLHTSWLNPDSEYEDSLADFVEAILTPSKDNLFIESFLPFQKMVASFGVWGSLSQTLIRITAPGMPDFYQGAEIWDLNLVDPDNRRPVDFEARRIMLRKLMKEERSQAGLIDDLLKRREDGRIKLFLINKALTARKNHSYVFQNGSYQALRTGGKYRHHVIAFARRHGKTRAMTVVPRFLTRLIGADAAPTGPHVWADTHILLGRQAPEVWTNAITGEPMRAVERISIADILSRFPAGLLIGEEA
jgi:(1->4)-alpha-D-glucan 1-alpha-D-glucosylmutase